jgi:hypothetical protein
MRDLVAGIDDRFDGVGIRFDGVPRHVPRCLDAVLLEEREESRRTHSRTELAARDPAGRRLSTRDETGDRVEIEGETDDVFGHCVATREA